MQILPNILNTNYTLPGVAYRTNNGEFFVNPFSQNILEISEKNGVKSTATFDEVRGIRYKTDESGETIVIGMTSASYYGNLNAPVTFNDEILLPSQDPQGDIFITSIDSNKNVKWTIHGGTTNDSERFRYARETSDSGILLLATSGSNKSGFKLGNLETTGYKSSAVISKISPTGEVEWIQQIGGSGLDYIDNAYETETGTLFHGVTKSDKVYYDNRNKSFNNLNEYYNGEGSFIGSISNKGEFNWIRTTLEGKSNSRTGGIIASFVDRVFANGKDTLFSGGWRAEKDGKTNANIFGKTLKDQKNHYNYNNFIGSINEQGETNWIKKVETTGYDIPGTISVTFGSSGGINLLRVKKLGAFRSNEVIKIGNYSQNIGSNSDAINEALFLIDDNGTPKYVNHGGGKIHQTIATNTGYSILHQEQESLRVTQLDNIGTTTKSQTQISNIEDFRIHGHYDLNTLTNGKNRSKIILVQAKKDTNSVKIKESNYDIKAGQYLFLRLNESGLWEDTIATEIIFNNNKYREYHGLGAGAKMHVIDNKMLWILSHEYAHQNEINGETFDPNTYGAVLIATDLNGKLIENNNSPTDISTSTSSFDENVEKGDIIAKLISSDSNLFEKFTYSLVNTDESPDNIAFTIDGDQLKINESPDYETQDSYSIRIKTTDSGNLSFEKAFTFAVNNIKETIEAATNKTLPSSIENLVLTGSGNLKGYGNTSNNRLTGNSGNNVLDGKGGIDTLIGKGGNDTYIVDELKDRVIEKADGGTDTIKSSVSETLSAHVENLVLTGTANLKGYGNTSNNRLTGNSGNNVLDGKGGIDTLIGKGGNDTYIVDESKDRVIEKAGGGTDTIRSSVNETLSANVENLVLTGSENLKGYGNNDSNRMVGNAGDNLLDGKGGIDTLIGKGGNDTYIVDESKDRVIEKADGGTDTIKSSANKTLSANVENLVLTGSENLKGYGNSGKNRLTGNSGDNVLEGKAGRDVLTGKDGGDKFIYRSIDDSGITKLTRDVITDFDGTESDVIDLSTIDAYTGEDDNPTFVYIGSDIFSGTQGEVRFESSILGVNTGTDKQADMQIKLNGVTDFSPDFLIL